MSKFARKIDTNQNSIVEILRRTGGGDISVAITSGLGNGFPDLVISWDKHTFLVELKTSDNLKLTDKEKAFHDSWNGHIIIATTAQEILMCIGYNDYGIDCPKHPQPFTLLTDPVHGS
jgi:hypothetical protein